jgi:hypothetical protein
LKSQSIDVAGVGQLVVEVDRGGVLEKLPEARAGVGKAPGGRFDLEVIEGLDGAAEKFRGHGKEDFCRGPMKKSGAKISGQSGGKLERMRGRARTPPCPP